MSALSLSDAQELLNNLPLYLREQERRNKRRIYELYPETGPLRRELYPKHLQYFAAGLTHNERLCCSANRIGKSEGIGAYEVAWHATGLYPDWWPGRRFTHPVQIWVAGKSGETTRDIIQAKLLGKLSRSKNEGASEIIGLGTGMIPGDAIIATSPKNGVPDGIDTAWVKHVSGGRSTIGFKSYGKERDSFEGTEKDVIWFDEEPPADVYDEAIMRLMATVPGKRNGLMILTFTPLDGYTSVIKSFFESNDPDKWFIQIGWADAPHLTPDVIATMSRKYLPSQLKARSKGEPSLGEGSIYPIEDLETLLVDPFRIPDTWPRCFGMDVGKTAVIWAAWDKDADTVYLYDEYFSEQYNPALHALSIKARGDWIPGAIDPASLGSSQVDGQNLLAIYRKHGLRLVEADNSVESGIQEVWMRLSTGRLKVFRTLNGWRNEFGRYHRRKVETVFGIQDKIVKKDDHRMDATRYLIMSGLAVSKCDPNVRMQPRSPYGKRINPYGEGMSADRSYGFMG